MNFTKLNDVLEKEIDVLSNIDVYDGGASKEIERGKTVARLAKATIDNAALALEIEKYKSSSNKKNNDLPSVLQTGA